MTFNRKQILNSTLSKAVSIVLCAFFLLASPAYSDSPKGNSSNDKQISQTNPTNALREAVNGDNQTGINKTKTPEKVQNTSLFSCLWNPIANFCICIWHCITWCWSWIVCIVVGTWHFLLGHWDGLVDLVMGLWNVICHPILTVKALYNSIMHPIVTFYFCWDALCELGSSARGWG